MDFSNMTVKQIIKKTRHKAEMPLWILAYIISGSVYLAAGIFGLLASVSPEFYNMLLESAEGDEVTIAILGICRILGFASALIVVLFFLVAMVVGMYKQYAEEMSYSVRVSEKNFPEIYAKAVEFSEKLGLKKVPEIYVSQENGMLNAFATIVPFKRYIQLNAEIVDVAYMENKDFDSVYFIMAHEFGHIYFNHSGLFRNLLIVFFRMIVPLNNLLSRAMEYSCDRAAQALTNDTCSVQSMMIAGAGRHLYKYVDHDDYINKAFGKYNFFERLSRFIVNLNANHPIVPFRIKALMDPERKSGRLI